MKLLVLITMLFAFNAKAQHGGGGGGMVEVQREFECASNNNKNATCRTGLQRTHQVYMARQLSKSACIQGQTFNIWGDKVTVSNGCRAVFVARGFTRVPQPGDKILEKQKSVRILCESNSYSPTTCRIPLRRVRQVYMEQQHSKTACVQGQNYTYNDRFIRVTGGCRATFVATGY